jgi:hypothetical protein
MAYNRFTLPEVATQFDLSIERDTPLFGSVAPVTPSEFLRMTLKRYLPLALDMQTEKARSEFIIAPILMEVVEQKERRVSLHSGVDFNVDRKSGLAGFCDYLFSASPERTEIVAPVLAVVEAKREDIPGGFGQCLAELVAAQKFNAQNEQPLPRVHGCVTTGDRWRFLRLEGTHASLDIDEYPVESIDKILGILLHVVSTPD